MGGRDKQYRPTLVVNTDIINFIEEYTATTITRAFSIMCIIMEDFCFYPGKVESWNIIIDLQERSSLAFKIDDYLKLVNMMMQNFPCTVEKIYCAHPSLSVQLQWGQLIDKIGNKKKMVICLDYQVIRKQFEAN